MAFEHPLYIATLRAVFRAQDDVEAIMIADQIKVNGEQDLEKEDGDSLDVTQVTQNMAELAPEETLMLLRRARNALIRTRATSFVECAREVDKCVHMLKNRSEKAEGIGLAKYDYTQFMEVMEEVLNGGNPTGV